MDEKNKLFSKDLIVAISAGLLSNPLIDNNYGMSRETPYNISENNNYSRTDQIFYTSDEKRNAWI